MPKEIKSAATKDASSVSKDRDLQASHKQGIPPSKLSKDEQYEQDLHTAQGSLEKVSQQRGNNASGSR